jgi:N-acetylneuraminate synthase
VSLFIVAEIGINHNGSLEVAKRLIDAARDCGADAVKFQKRTVELVYANDFLDSPRVSPWGSTQRDQKRGLELEEDEYAQIDAHCRDRGIEWFASAWDPKSYEFLRKFDLKHNKVASAMIANEDLLEAIAGDGKPTFISTGMSTLVEIDRAVAIFRAARCPFQLMHCVSAYPTQDGDVNLNAIPALRARYACDVGYSGHEAGLVVSYAATALGITSLERHITLDRTLYGSDQAASLEPAEFRSLVEGVRRIEAARGDGGIGRPGREALRVGRKLRPRLAPETR